MMRNPHPVAIFWGEELTMIYNQGYQVLLGNQPALGVSYDEAFPATWNIVRITSLSFRSFVPFLWHVTFALDSYVQTLVQL